MMVLFMPDALEALTGLRIDDLRDQLLDATTVLPNDWLPMLRAVQEAPDDGHALERLEDFLDPLWQRCRSSQPGALLRYSDWVTNLAQRAALSGPGRSLRQLERRIKRWSGLPLRELRVMERAEEAFIATSALATQARSKMDWAHIAAETGYYDQSHMIRATRRVTGFTPEALSQGIQHEESFWAYRLWM
jgi:AraC-like DNA-binding protein